MQDNLFQQDPREFEDWEDIIAWKMEMDSIFKSSTRQFFSKLITKISEYYWTECINNKELSEISGIVDLYDISYFIDDKIDLEVLYSGEELYEVCALFTNNKRGERFFILKKNDEYYKLDISKQYLDLCKY